MFCDVFIIFVVIVSWMGVEGLFVGGFWCFCVFGVGFVVVVVVVCWICVNVVFC